MAMVMGRGLWVGAVTCGAVKRTRHKLPARPPTQSNIKVRLVLGDIIFHGLPPPARLSWPPLICGKADSG